jgi:hypothetical protein
MFNMVGFRNDLKLIFGKFECSIKGHLSSLLLLKQRLSALTFTNALSSLSLPLAFR